MIACLTIACLTIACLPLQRLLDDAVPNPRDQRRESETHVGVDRLPKKVQRTPQRHTQARAFEKGYPWVTYSIARACYGHWPTTFRTLRPFQGWPLARRAVCGLVSTLLDIPCHTLLQGKEAPHHGHHDAARLLQVGKGRAGPWGGGRTGQGVLGIRLYVCPVGGQPLGRVAVRLARSWLPAWFRVV
jgi:hypothetical protein